ncbi:DUF4387 domain-containing protein [Virgibacillus tibetensis]|uniref:DUF4387 domain-containing protein n=1 Tax=Virgibacillus tibetensis TaxID=3042313 RepID=UPI002E16DED1
MEIKKRVNDVAKIVRSKNAGPFLITLDIIFSKQEDYDKFKNGNYVSKRKIAELYQIELEKVIECLFYDNARAFKTTIKRGIPSGSVGDTDIYGVQQHVPLLHLELPNW